MTVEGIRMMDSHGTRASFLIPSSPRGACIGIGGTTSSTTDADGLVHVLSTVASFRRHRGWGMRNRGGEGCVIQAIDCPVWKHTYGYE